MSRRTRRQQATERELREVIARRGLKVEGGGRYDRSVRVRGPGVDVMAPKLADLTLRDLEPVFDDDDA